MACMWLVGKLGTIDNSKPSNRSLRMFTQVKSRLYRSDSQLKQCKKPHARTPTNATCTTDPPAPLRRSLRKWPASSDASA
jgi:hypothetical protein